MPIRPWRVGTSCNALPDDRGALHQKDSEKLAEKLSKTSLLVFDTETDSLNPSELNILGASFSTKAGEGYFVAIDPGSRLFSDGKKRLPVDDFKKLFKPILENKKSKKFVRMVSLIFQ